jgi:diaminopimelate decarboxylase
LDHFQFSNAGILHAEAVPLPQIAERFGTPCYVYSQATLDRHWQVFEAAFQGLPHRICYAVKANGNLAILERLLEWGASFDIVSLGELERVLTAGGDGDDMVFSGVGKRRDEMERALEVGIHCFNVESAAELERLAEVARAAGTRAPIALRVNPDVDPQTHPYIATGLAENKFGIPIEAAPALYRWAAEQDCFTIRGIDCHIGSQLTDIEPLMQALDHMLALADRLAREGIAVEHLDLGGGLGIAYRDETPPDPATWGAAVRERLADRPYEILIEPGRSIIGNAGILLTRVELIKRNGDRPFVVVDAAMNDLIRPALYDAWQAVEPVASDSAHPLERVDVVGPVCETGDFLAKQRDLRVGTGDLLAIRSAGAYGFAMASNYNGRPRPPEVLVEGDQVHLIRARETLDDLWRGERCLALERQTRVNSG